MRRALLLLAFLTGCQTFPQGERLPELEREYEKAGQDWVSTLDLYRYYAMCRAAWRRYEEWQDSGWELDYFYEESTETLGLIIPEEDRIYIIFRSSRALQQTSVDFNHNSRIRLVPLPFMPDSGIKAHRGFVQKYMSIRETLLQRVAESGVDTIILVGHSGGAAINALAFIDLKTLYPQAELRLVSFGASRVLNRKGARWCEPYNRDIIRVVNGRDIIPNLPPALFGYRHIGRLLRIGSRRWYQIYSAYAHHPGYQKVLEQRLREKGIDPELLGY